MSEFRQYDYIIAGAGCAGLSLLVHMIHSNHFASKKILLIDKSAKDQNDRTWCFWEDKPGLFEDVVHHTWDKIRVHSDDIDETMDIAPYKYKLIRGINFYRYALGLIKQQSNIEVRYSSVESLGCDNEGAYVIANGQRINAEYIFNSILFEVPVMRSKEYYLLQHFRGWVIETETPVFDEETATLMDFDVEQKHGTSFVYIMPFSMQRALIEYTLFSKEVLPIEEYEYELQEYIAKRYPGVEYRIDEKEVGVIPMTNHRFPTHEDKIINIGTAGGQTKGSSGYTFQFIQKHSAEIVAKLSKGETPVFKRSFAQKRYHFFDSVLLELLYHKKMAGDQIFSTLFKKNKVQNIFRFLDNEGSILDDIRVINSLPKAPFIRAAMKQI